MLKELFSMASGDAPIRKAETEFSEMLELVRGMLLDANEAYWGPAMSPDARKNLYKRDVRVNKLERSIRALVITHLSGTTSGDVPYSLMLMSLVKDLERLGDYAKNLSEVPGTSHPPDGQRTLPSDELVTELRQISDFVQSFSTASIEAWNASDVERARELIVEARSTAKQCDQLVQKIACADYSAGMAVDLALGSRHYKRILAHLLNLISSVVMPLHKLDFFDEDELSKD